MAFPSMMLALTLRPFSLLANRTGPLASLVAEVAAAGVDHDQAVRFDGGQDLLIPHRPTGLNDGGHARLGGAVDAVPEREERIGAQDAAARPVAGVPRSDVHRVQAVDLAGTDPPRGLLAREP